MSLRHRQPFTCRFSEELRVKMELWTRVNDSSQAELVRRAVREFLDRRPLKELGFRPFKNAMPTGQA